MLLLQAEGYYVARGLSFRYLSAVAFLCADVVQFAMELHRMHNIIGSRYIPLWPGRSWNSTTMQLCSHPYARAVVVTGRRSSWSCQSV